MSSLQPPRMLVVDDHRDRASFLCALFTANGFEVASTPVVERAADSVRDEGVAVVLVAYQGDAESTARALRELRTRPESEVRDVAVVALVDDPWAADQAVAAGADAVLVRPLHASRLIAVVSRSAATRPASRVARRTAI